jgi:hypothetical protein
MQLWVMRALYGFVLNQQKVFEGLYLHLGNKNKNLTDGMGARTQYKGAQKMANALYDWGREKFLAGDLDWDGHAIDCWLIDDAFYTKNLATDQNLDDVPDTSPSPRIAQVSDLSSKTVTDGVADAADITFTSVSGAQSEELVINRDSGAEATSTLICNIDTATGLPVTPSGSNIDVTWDSGANKIFKL